MILTKFKIFITYKLIFFKNISGYYTDRWSGVVFEMLRDNKEGDVKIINNLRIKCLGLT